MPSVIPYQVLNAQALGADGTGATDSTAVFQMIAGMMGSAGSAAASAIPATIDLGTGVYKTSFLPVFAQNQGMRGDGEADAIVQYTGTTTALTAALKGSFNGSAVGGKFSGFTLDGSLAGGSANGFQYGDLQAIDIDGVTLTSFGGTGLVGQNGNGRWAEQGNVRMRIISCGTMATLNNGSFDYTNWDLTVVTPPGGHGLILSTGVSGAQIQGGRLRLRGNFYASVGNTAAVIDIDPGNTAGTSYITNTEMDVSVETSGTGTGHYTVRMGSQNSVSQFCDNTGALSFKNVSVNFLGASNPNFLPFGFSGVLLDTVLGLPTPGDSIQLVGLVDYSESYSPSLFASTLFLETGDIQTFGLSSGVNVLVLSGVGTYSHRIDLFIKQPASGSAGTITWPANVKFPGGTKPTLSGANNAIDHVRLVYLPSQNNFYGELVGVAYA